MNNRIILFLIVLIIFSCDRNKYAPVDLKTEYSVNPLGIDTDFPRFSWKLPENSNVKTQLFYQVLVTENVMDLKKSKSIVWDSGKIKSDLNLVVFDGKKLLSNTRYHWVVKVWDDKGNESPYSKYSSFQTGIKDNWNAKWITDKEDIDEKRAPYFKKEFKTHSAVQQATVYIGSAGLHNFKLNGKKVGDEFMNPIYTRFDKRILYNTYDVTDLLKSNNIIDIVLGNGWINHQSIAVWNFHKAHWRSRPRFTFEMIIDYKNGKQEKIVSDKSWKTSFGNIQFNSIYTAEHTDNNKGNKFWKPIIEVPKPTEKITSQQLPPVRKVRVYPAVSCVKVSEDTYLFDFAQNMSGITELKVNGPKGTVARVKHGEQLKDGRLDNSGIEVHYRPIDDKDPFQTDIYTLSGNGQEIFSPMFNYKGFRYAEVKIDNKVELNKNNLTAYFTHTDVDPIGTVETSNNLINKIWDATNKAYLSNLFGYPTDCPQREKNGWTGDAHTVIETALFNFDGILVYEKWMDDHRDEQQIDGTLPSIIPTAGWGYSWGNGPDWTSSMILVPWNVYKFYGDTRILEENYENMRRYVFKIKSVSKDNLTSWGLGDWVPVKSKSNLEFTSSIFYYTDVLLISKIAKILGHNNEAFEFKNLAIDIKSSINNKYFDKETNTYASGTQTEMSMALFRGIVDKEKKQLVADKLAKSVIENNSKLDVGLLGSKTILNALSQNGYANLAFKLASSKEYPSWGYWIENGATTLYENWDLSAESDLSLNHIMFGEVSAWFYKTLGGINTDENNPGFKNILLKPHFVNDLTDFKVTFMSPHGKVVSSWKRIGDIVIYKVIIPPNSLAELFFDNSVKEVIQKKLLGTLDLSKPFILEPGNYEFEIH